MILDKGPFFLFICMALSIRKSQDDQGTIVPNLMVDSSFSLTLLSLFANLPSHLLVFVVFTPLFLKNSVVSHFSIRPDFFWYRSPVSSKDEGLGMEKVVFQILRSC